MGVSWKLPCSGLRLFGACVSIVSWICHTIVQVVTVVLVLAGILPPAVPRSVRDSTARIKPACQARTPSRQAKAGKAAAGKRSAAKDSPANKGSTAEKFAKADVRGCQSSPAPQPAAATSRASHETAKPGGSTGAGHGAVSLADCPGSGCRPAGYGPLAEGLREAEFGRLAGKVYADYAGAPPYAASLLRAATEELLASLHGNPHSAYGWAQHTAEAASERVRLLTLAMCRADPQRYECIITSGATGALKLVGEAFPWGAGSALLHLRDNHNSTVGIRQLAVQRGATSAAVQVAAFNPGAVSAEATAGGPSLSARLSDGAGKVPSGAPAGQQPALILHTCGSGCGGTGAFGGGDRPGPGSSGGSSLGGSTHSRGGDGTGQGEGRVEPQHLFALPLESNLWGVQYDERLVLAVQQGRFELEDERGRHPATPGRWRVLLDAAKGCASHPPDLSRHPADFVSLSFYKIFGYPTGVGALVVRRDALASLEAGKAYFGGGTVSISLAEEMFHRRRLGAAGLEDGTLPFLQLPAVLHGFGFIQRLGGFPVISAHAGAVARHLVEQLLAARHPNGAPLCVVYGAWPGARGLLQHEGSRGLSGIHHAAGEGPNGGGPGEESPPPAAAAEGEVGREQQGQQAQHAQRGAKQLEAPEVARQAIACHRALQRTHVLQHSRRRRMHRTSGEGSGGGTALGGEEEGQGTHSSGMASPSSSLASRDGGESQRDAWDGEPPLDAELAPRHAALRWLSVGSAGEGGAGGRASRAGSINTEATLYFSPRSSMDDGAGWGSESMATGSAVDAAATAGGSLAHLPGPAAIDRARDPLRRAPAEAAAEFAACGGAGDQLDGIPSCEQQHPGLRPRAGCCECGELPLQLHQELLRQRGVTGQGPVVAFNVLRADGSCVGYREVEKLGSLHGIFLRTGCMCNPGGCAQALGLTPAEMKANFEAGHMCWDDRDVIAGKPTGLVRASFGYASTLADADSIVGLLERYFVEREQAGPPSGDHAPPPSRHTADAAARSPAQPPSPPAVDGLGTGRAVGSGAQAAAGSCALPPWPDSAAFAPPLPPPAALETHQAPVASARGGGGGGGSGGSGGMASGAAGAAAHGLPPAEAVGNGELRGGSGLVVEAISIYPIKSCRGMEADVWPLGPTGLLYDRHWVLVDGAGTALKLRKVPALATIQPHLDLQQGVLRVTADGMPDALELPLDGCGFRESQLDGGAAIADGCGSALASGGRRGGGDGGEREVLTSIRVCSRDECALSVGAGTLADAGAVSSWFEQALGVPCRLVQQTGPAGMPGGQHQPGSPGDSGRDLGSSQAGSPAQHAEHAGQAQPAPPRSFANEGQLLLVSSASLADLQARLASAGGDTGSSASSPASSAVAPSATCRPVSASLAALARRFRPNLVVGGPGAQPYCEDSWARVEVAGVALRSAGGCPRCDMVCMDPLTGRREGPEPLLTLAGCRRTRGPGGGKICFGVLFNQDLLDSSPEQAIGGDSLHTTALDTTLVQGAPTGSLAVWPGAREGRSPQLQWIAGRFRQFVAVGMAVISV